MQFVDLAEFEKFLDREKKAVVTTEYSRINWETPYVTPTVLGRLDKSRVRKLRSRLYEVRR